MEFRCVRYVPEARRGNLEYRRKLLPEFFFALYEKNGMHLETILTNFISVRFKRPAVRRYEVENLYERELETAAPIQKKGGILGKK